MTVDQLIDDLQYYQKQGKGKCTVSNWDCDEKLIVVDENKGNIVLLFHDDPRLAG